MEAASATPSHSVDLKRNMSIMHLNDHRRLNCTTAAQYDDYVLHAVLVTGALASPAVPQGREAACL